MSDKLADLTDRSDDWRKGYWDNVTGEQFGGGDNSEYAEGWAAGWRDSDKINRPEGDDPRGDDGPYSHEADGYMRTVPGELFDDDPEPSALGVVLSRAVFDVLDHDPEAFKRAGGVIVDE